MPPCTHDPALIQEVRDYLYNYRQPDGTYTLEDPHAHTGESLALYFYCPRCGTHWRADHLDDARFIPGEEIPGPEY